MSRLVAVVAATTIVMSLNATTIVVYAAEQPPPTPVAGHNINTVSGTGRASTAATVASTRSTSAPSTRMQRQAVVKVTRSKVKGKKRYTVSLSPFVGDVYLKWGMSNKSWRWQRTSVDQSVSIRAAKPVTWVTVRADGYVPLTKRKVSGKSWATRLTSTGKPLPWEVDGDASMHEFAVPSGLGELTPMRWDPCTYTYSAPSGSATVTSAAHNRTTLTWSLESGQFAQPWVSQAFSHAAAASGWTFTQVAPGGQANIPVYVDTQAPTMSLNGVGYTHWEDHGYSSARITASIDSHTPQAMKVRLFMHEIGHVLGLDHAESMSQVMYPEIPWAGEARFGAGDRAGLASVGAGQSCVWSVGEHVWR